MAVVSRRTTKRAAGAAVTAVAGGGFFVGLSRVGPVSLAVLGATVVILALVMAFTGYKALDRLLQYLERQPPETSDQPPAVAILPRNRRTPA
jgi:membrane protein implicated in regulation of membrane protease activity